MLQFFKHKSVEKGETENIMKHYQFNSFLCVFIYDFVWYLQSKWKIPDLSVDG